MNHGARDSRIKVQTYSPVRKLDGLPLELFQHYWRDVHGPLCSRLPGLGFYVQHHFSREHTANLWPTVPGVAAIDFMLDGMVEIGFANEADLATFAAASPILFGDEVNCFGWDAAFFLPQGSTTYVDQQADGIPNGPDRLHRLHVYLHGAMDEAFKTWAREFASTLARSDSVQKLRLHLPEEFDNANPQPPSPVDHHVPDDLRRIAVMEIGFVSALTAKQFFESEVCTSTLEGQSAHVEAIKVVRVTGVYTYVRDGVPTMAGIRGSRTSEIIEAIGATNHVAADVVKLFLRG